MTTYVLDNNGRVITRDEVSKDYDGPDLHEVEQVLTFHLVDIKSQSEWEELFNINTDYLVTREIDGQTINTYPREVSSDDELTLWHIVSVWHPNNEDGEA